MQVTVIIRDDSPMLHRGDSPSYRSVAIDLTPEQVQRIGLWHVNERYSHCFIEPMTSEEGATDGRCTQALRILRRSCQ